MQRQAGLVAGNGNGNNNETTRDAARGARGARCASRQQSARTAISSASSIHWCVVFVVSRVVVAPVARSWPLGYASIRHTPYASRTVPRSMCVGEHGRD